MDDTNIFRPFLYEMFPNLETVLLKSGAYRFNPLSLLNVLVDVSVPSSLRTVRVEWAWDEFNAKGIIEEYEINNILVEKYRNGRMSMGGHVLLKRGIVN